MSRLLQQAKLEWVVVSKYCQEAAPNAALKSVTSKTEQASVLCASWVQHLHSPIELACIAAGFQHSIVGDCVWLDVPCT